MKHVLVAIDGSAASVAALREVLRRGPREVAHIDLVNVQPRLPRSIARWIPRSQRDGWRAERGAAALAEARRVVAASGIPWRDHVAVGEMPATLHAAARQWRCDEIVRQPRWNARLERYLVPAGIGLVALMLLADE
jgi:nucleotide-binding universal stress UspA family protein